MTPSVDPEFTALIPPLTQDEYDRLKVSVVLEGCRDALVVWEETGILLDGHNRLRICEEYGIDYHTTMVPLDDREMAEAWIIQNQLGRRNLHPDAAALLRGRLYNMQKHQGERTDLTSCTFCTKLQTAECLATQLGVSARTVKNDGKLADAVDTLEPFMPGIAASVMAGVATGGTGQQ